MLYFNKRVYNKLYYNEHKEYISRQILCSCGSIVRYNALSYHKRSRKHLQTVI